MIEPGMPNAPYEIELTDSRSRIEYGLKIPQSSLQIGTISQDDTVYVRSVGKRVGDFDEQRSWKGGRGNENLSDNAESFWDSMNAWTLTPGHVHQTLQWYHARGLRNEDMYMPTASAGSMSWHPVLSSGGAAGWVATTLTASANYSVLNLKLWIRRKGTPGTATIYLYSSSGGSPNAALQSTTITTASDVTDTISVYLSKTITSQAVTSGTVYWIVFKGGADDDHENHWEVGTDTSTTNSKTSANGTAWSAASFTMYARMTDADIARRWYRFQLSGAWYVVDNKDDYTTASVCYINGDRGTATSATSTTITDSTKSWTTNRWAGAWVKITASTGQRNTPRQIVSNTATTITFSPAFDITPTSTSQYYIYATEWFTSVSITGASFGAVSSQPIVANDVAYFPQEGAGILHVRWDGVTNKRHDGFTETPSGTTVGYADGFLSQPIQDPTAGPVVWRWNNTGATGSGGVQTVSRAPLIVAGSPIAWNTALTFGTSIRANDSTYFITGLAYKDRTLYVHKQDGAGVVVNDQYTKMETGEEDTPDPANGVAALAHQQFIYRSWLHSVIRLYGSSHDDIGQDFRSAGLPTGREGNVEDISRYISLVLFAVDAGASGTSSVLSWDGLAWHEMLRAPKGKRVRFVKPQTCYGTRNRLWTSFGDDLVFQEMPHKKVNPRLDSGAHYMHEAVMSSSVIDMGTASGMAKFIKELTVTVNNLNTQGREIYVDYQTDDNCLTENWIPAGMITRSPESTQFLGLEDVNRFCYRLRMLTNSNTTPVDVVGVVPNGYARTPYKMQWTMQIDAGNVSRKGKTVSSDELMRWLLDSARQPYRVKMRSTYELAHDWWVVVHPPKMFPISPRKGAQGEKARFTLALREA